MPNLTLDYGTQISHRNFSSCQNKLQIYHYLFIIIAQMLNVHFTNNVQKYNIECSKTNMILERVVLELSKKFVYKRN
jgi:hypothetical protein